MGGDALIHLQLRPSIRSLPEHLLDSGVRERESLREHMDFRWVAEVITFDLPADGPRPQPASDRP